MSIADTRSTDAQKFLDKVAGLTEAGGNARTKKIVRRILGDLFATIEDFNITEDEFWHALAFLSKGAPEFGLMAPGLGLEHLLDVRMDEADRRAGIAGGTPRTIEGPLYVAGAPLVQHEARLDDGSEEGTLLTMEGRVVDQAGKPVAGAIVDVWHANTLGRYSHFDPSQSPFNLRRRIAVDAEGRYRFRTILPKGYAVPPGGATERLLDQLGRHGRRPAHIHFFISAPGHRHLTTQINIDQDPDLWEDFAYATRDGLVPPLERTADGASIRFDFMLPPARTPEEAEASTRPRLEVAA